MQSSECPRSRTHDVTTRGLTPSRSTTTAVSQSCTFGSFRVSRSAACAGRLWHPLFRRTSWWPGSPGCVGRRLIGTNRRAQRRPSRLRSIPAPWAPFGSARSPDELRQICRHSVSNRTRGVLERRLVQQPHQRDGRKYARQYRPRTEPVQS
jgi:hypothetical protein